MGCPINDRTVDLRIFLQRDTGQTAFTVCVDEPEDMSGHWTFVQELAGRPICDNTNVYSMEEGGGHSFEYFRPHLSTKE